MNKHLQLGQEGESIAIQYLKSKGYLILKQNWRYKHKEIDIVAQIGRFIVIVEVKTRSNSRVGAPQEFVDYGKINHLLDAANHLAESFDQKIEFRFDVLSIIKNDESPIKIDHFVDAFTS